MLRTLACSLLFVLASCTSSPSPAVSTASAPSAPAGQEEGMSVVTVDQTIAQFIATKPELKQFSALIEKEAPEDSIVRNQSGDPNAHALVIAPNDSAMKAYAAASSMANADVVRALTLPLDGPTPIQKMGESLTAANGDLAIHGPAGEFRLIGDNPWRVRNQAGDEAKVQTFYMTKYGNIVLVVDKVVLP